MSIEVCIPRDEWDAFKSAVLGKWFASDNPILSRHAAMKHPEYEYACFSSDYREDVDYVISIIPDGGSYSF